jgi:predicted nucleic-acid-binding Zn-ribbon protein
MTITNCPKCGSMNITTAGVCANCGWSQFAQVTTVSTRITGEIEIMLSGKALLDDYKRLLFENRNLKERVAELEAAQRWIPVSERLPLLRYSNAVLVYTKSGEIYSGLYLGNNEWTGLLHDFREGEVTHWMPLPELPEV